jgi:hypothetical protein
MITNSKGTARERDTGAWPRPASPITALTLGASSKTDPSEQVILLVSETPD